MGMRRLRGFWIKFLGPGNHPEAESSVVVFGGREETIMKQ
jgi:hypothetical protein